MTTEGIRIGTGTTIHQIAEMPEGLYTVCGADFAKRGRYNKGTKVQEAPTCTRCHKISK
jgi:hypothetical protein